MPLSSVLGAQSLVRPGVCTSSTRPASPFEGQLIFETDTNRVVAYDGSAWVYAVDTDQPPGLQLVKAQTIGSAVSSVTVSDAFSADFDVYEIIVSGGAHSTTAGINMTLGSASSNYYLTRSYVDYATATYGDTSVSNGVSWTAIGIGVTSSISVNVRIANPFATKQTIVSFNYGVAGTSFEYQWGGGFLNDTTSYTAFTLTPSTGTMTGGTIRVYGYRNS